MLLIVNLTQSPESLNEGLSRPAWPVGMSSVDYFILIVVGSLPTEGSTPFFRRGVLSCRNVAKANQVCAFDCRYD